MEASFYRRTKTVVRMDFDLLLLVYHFTNNRYVRFFNFVSMNMFLELFFVRFLFGAC